MILLFKRFESGLSAFRYTHFNTTEINIQVIFMLEFPQNYPHQINLLCPVIHNFKKMPKI